MKLTHLVEGFHNVDREVYRLEVYIQDNHEEYVGIVLDVDIKQYDTYVTDSAGVMRDILNDMYSIITTNEPDKNIMIYSIVLKDHLNGGGSSILIGNHQTLFNFGGRLVPISIDNVEEGIEEYIEGLRPLNFPTGEECMTRLKRDNKIVTALTRKYKVKDINIELHVLPKMNSVCNIIMTPPEGMDEEQFGLELAKGLKPYKIRPQINGGPIIGTRSL